jgi:hypothetical protein
MAEALQLWKNIAGKGGDGSPDDKKPSRGKHVTNILFFKLSVGYIFVSLTRLFSLFSDGESSVLAGLSEKNGQKNTNPSDSTSEQPAKTSSNGSPTSDPAYKAKSGGILEKAVVILKKKAPALTDKELNPEFFHNLETRGSDDLPVEVVVPRRCLGSSNSNNEEESEPNDTESRGRSNRIGNIQSDDFHGSFNSKYHNVERGTAAVYSKQRDHDDLARDKWPEERINGKDSRMRAFDGDDRIDINQRESSSNRVGFSKTDGQSEGSFINNKGNWLAIQRQLLQLERQQAHLMNMLQVHSI